MIFAEPQAISETAQNTRAQRLHTSWWSTMGADAGESLAYTGPVALRNIAGAGGGPISEAVRNVFRIPFLGILPQAMEKAIGIDFDSRPITQASYPTSPYFREGVKWRSGLTVGEAKFKANAFDNEQRRQFLLAFSIAAGNGKGHRD